MSTARLTEIHVHPVKGEPGRLLSEGTVDPEGLAGDRRKKAPVHVVGVEDVREDTRANLIVTLTQRELASSMGSVLQVGDVELEVESVPANCPGVYAAVRTPGDVRIGDAVTVHDASQA